MKRICSRIVRRLRSLVVVGFGTAFLMSGVVALAPHVSASPTSTVIVNSGLTGPFNIAFDHLGNMYIAGGDQGTIDEITASALNGTAPYTPTPIVTGLIRPDGVAIDAAGDLYIVDQQSSNVYVVSATQLQGAAPFTPTVAFVLPTGGANDLAFDSAGDVFVTDSTFHSTVIWGVSASQLLTPSPVVTIITASSPSPDGITIDPSGNLFVANTSGDLDEITAAQLATNTGFYTPTELVSSADIPQQYGVVSDGVGDLFLQSQANENIYEVTAAQIASSTRPVVPEVIANIATSTTPVGISLDAAGNFFVVDYTNGTITRVVSVGTNPAPPAPPAPPSMTGLSAAQIDGELTATWNAVPSATSYTCTLLFGFDTPSTFTTQGTSPTCSFPVANGASYGVSVTATTASGTTAAVSAWPSSPPIPANSTPHGPATTSIVCVMAGHSKRVKGVRPRCPSGWHRKS